MRGDGLFSVGEREVIAAFVSCPGPAELAGRAERLNKGGYAGTVAYIRGGTAKPAA
jgi:hypothetical protein